MPCRAGGPLSVRLGFASCPAAFFSHFGHELSCSANFFRCWWTRGADRGVVAGPNGSADCSGASHLEWHTAEQLHGSRWAAGGAQQSSRYRGVAQQSSCAHAQCKDIGAAAAGGALNSTRRFVSRDSSEQHASDSLTASRQQERPSERPAHFKWSSWQRFHRARHVRCRPFTRRRRDVFRDVHQRSSFEDSR